MEIELARGDPSWKRVEPLEVAVYTPEVVATVPWRGIAWANADWRVLVCEADAVAAHVGLYLRDARLDGAPVRIGGIGGVMTHPQHRRRGLAGAALQRGLAFLGEEAVDFALLFCEPKMIAFYAALGFRLFDGDVMVEQPSGRVLFTVTRVMTRDVAVPAPSAGAIDLCGLPW